MYHEDVVRQRVEGLEAALRVRLRRRPVEEVDRIRGELEGSLTPEGKLKRQPTPEELEFIRSERLLCRSDFRYWCERYAVVPRDGSEGGGVGRIRFWASQEMALAEIARIEKECYEAKLHNEATDGIRVVMAKARQLGATMLSRLLLTHRLTNWRHMRAMAASIDDDKIMELYDRDKLIVDNLPFYLKPSVGYDVKAAHLYFDKLNSRILYQQSRQQSGIGQGRQFDLAHLTECAFWPYPDMIELDFLPTLPLGPATLCMLESTANGLGGWWYDFTEDVRKGLRRGWRYIFAPWYIEPRKNRAHPPADWNPSKLTMQHARKVYDTSRDWTGRDVLLDREQLYWYETEREAAIRRGKLNLFLTNYCATPEESFQHTGSSQFSVEVLERIRLGTTKPHVYEMRIQ